VRIYIGESDQWHGGPLYAAIVQEARRRGLTGATVTRGIMGYGANSVIHEPHLFRLSNDLPIVIEIVDTDEKIRAFVPCLDEMVRTTDRSGFYYESIDLFDAFHPQTILAYEMNGSTLPVRHGAPLRLRVERQVGYKHAKFVTRIEAVERLNRLGRGKGGFWEDRGYQWYGGI